MSYYHEIEPYLDEFMEYGLGAGLLTNGFSSLWGIAAYILTALALYTMAQRAATARLTASINVSSVVSRSNLPFLIRVNANINTQIPRTSFVRSALSWESLFCKGVSPSSA